MPRVGGFEIFSLSNDPLFAIYFTDALATKKPKARNASHQFRYLVPSLKNSVVRILFGFVQDIFVVMVVVTTTKGAEVMEA